MKNSFYLLACILVFAQCAPKIPVYQGIEKVYVNSATQNEIKISADLLFHNPNFLGGKLQSNGISVFINDMEVGIVEAKEFKIPLNEKFILPITANILKDKIITHKDGGLIQGLLSALLEKKITVRYKGSVNYSALGFSHNYPVDFSKEIKMKF